MNRLKQNLTLLQRVLEDEITDDNKWAIYSISLNIIKFILEDLIENNLTAEEKRSDSYKQLIETLKLNIEHLNLSTKTSFFNKKNALLAGGSVALVEIIRLLIQIAKEFL